VDHDAQKTVEHPDRLGGRKRRRALRERANVHEHNRNDLLDAAEPRIARQDLLRRPSPNMQTERLPQSLFLAQLMQHVVELRDEKAELVRARQMQITVEASFGNALGRAAQLIDRLGNEAAD
jgi:hypothetical protein